jgi:LacI family kdg operon repressor
VNAAVKAGNKVTINDIAAAAGVSKTTVSRYINGQEHLMSEKTRNRLKTVIELLNYHPSDIARSLKSKKTNMIGVVISNITSPFFSAVIVGIGSVLARNNYTPLFVNCDDDIAQEEQYIRSFIAREVDGLIVNTSSNTNKFLISVACQGMPVVLCDRYIKDYNFDIVGTKNQEMLFSIINHLKEQGFSRPAMFTQSYEQNSARKLRREGFLGAMRQIYGVNAEKDVYVVSDEEADAVRQLRKFLSTVGPEESPAIFCVNSVTTVRMYHAIKELGLNVPDDVGLCGPDDWNWDNGMNWPDIMETSITTMTIHARRIGECTAELLLKRLEYPDMLPQEILLPTQLHVRDSTRRKRV